MQSKVWICPHTTSPRFACISRGDRDGLICLKCLLDPEITWPSRAVRPRAIKVDNELLRRLKASETSTISEETD